jgi:DNA-binding NtrC family response regulator
MSVDYDSKRVLVVDDESTIADALAKILRTHGYVSRAEYNGRAAMYGAVEFRPHFLIADIVMPGMSGIELAEWFVEEQPACRVLLTSANLLHFDPGYLEFPNSDRVEFLPKPVLIPKLLDFLHRHAEVT